MIDLVYAPSPMPVLRASSPVFRPKAIVPLGDAAVLIEFADRLDLEINAFIQRFTYAIRDSRAPWIRDIVPALGSLAIHVDPESLGNASALEAVERLVVTVLNGRLPAISLVGRIVKVPVCYDTSFALDLEDVCRRTRLTPEVVTRLHAANEYRVLMVGFAPGHPYLGGLDPRLSVPRRASPRTRMPRGAIAIANTQCVVYPYAIPGGWSIVGRTPLRIFDASRTAPSLFAPGDRVRFEPIDRAAYDRLAEQDGTTE